MTLLLVSTNYMNNLAEWSWREKNSSVQVFFLRLDVYVQEQCVVIRNISSKAHC